jgi:hypothetical protein
MTTIAEHGDWRMRLEQDEDPLNPRTDYDHIESVVTVPSREYLPVDKDGGPLSAQWQRLLDRYRHRDAIELFVRYAQLYHGAVCRVQYPRNGPVSVWYLTREVYDGPNGTPDPAAYLKGQADEYESWAEGDVWGYIIERRVSWTRDDDPNQHMRTWETVDSCWGFIGYTYAEQEAQQAWDAHVRP